MQNISVQFIVRNARKNLRIRRPLGKINNEHFVHIFCLIISAIAGII